MNNNVIGGVYVVGMVILTLYTFLSLLWEKPAYFLEDTRHEVIYQKL